MPFLIEITTMENAHFQRELLKQKVFLRYIKWEEKWTYHKEQSSRLTTFFANLISVLEPLTNSQFKVPITQISILTFLVF